MKAAASSLVSREDGARERASRVEVASGNWDMVDTTWYGTDVLAVVWPERWYSVWVLRGPDGATFGYYVNFEVPYVRTPIGFDTTDLCLDLVVGSDGSWDWKDRDDYHDRVRLGLITPEHAASVDAAVDDVLAGIRERDCPFDGSFDAWHPDPSWTVPPLPDRWASSFPVRG